MPAAICCIPLLLVLIEVFDVQHTTNNVWLLKAVIVENLPGATNRNFFLQ